MINSFENLEVKVNEFMKITPAIKQEDSPLGQKSTNIIQYKNDFVNKNNKNIKKSRQGLKPLYHQNDLLGYVYIG